MKLLGKLSKNVIYFYICICINIMISSLDFGAFLDAFG